MVKYGLKCCNKSSIIISLGMLTESPSAPFSMHGAVSVARNNILSNFKTSGHRICISSLKTHPIFFIHCKHFLA
jgi:hypothetical protein